MIDSEAFELIHRHRLQIKPDYEYDIVPYKPGDYIVGNWAFGRPTNRREAWTVSGGISHPAKEPHSAHIPDSYFQGIDVTHIDLKTAIAQCVEQMEAALATGLSD